MLLYSKRKDAEIVDTTMHTLQISNDKENNPFQPNKYTLTHKHTSFLKICDAFSDVHMQRVNNKSHKKSVPPQLNDVQSAHKAPTAQTKKKKTNYKQASLSRHGQHKTEVSEAQQESASFVFGKKNGECIVEGGNQRTNTAGQQWIMVGQNHSLPLPSVR